MLGLLLLSCLTVLCLGAPKAGVGCATCVAFMDDAEGELLDIVLQVGISEGCAVCGRLKNHLEQTVCGILCEIVGIEAFVKVLRQTDLDPIYVCSELLACPKNHCLQPGCTSINSVTVTPPSGPVGTVFNVTVVIQARNQTGTGVTVLEWKCPTTGMTGAPILNEGFRAKSINHITYRIDTRNDACLYAPATYALVVGSCAYDCQDQHGVVYAAVQSQFTITQ